MQMIDFNNYDRAVAQLEAANIPPHMIDAVIKYVWYGLQPGGFLEAVFANDLRGAVQRADHINQRHIADYVQMLMWAVPADCHGSYERVDIWIRSRGVHGSSTEDRPSTEETAG